jgi:hypothetical protein
VKQEEGRKRHLRILAALVYLFFIPLGLAFYLKSKIPVLQHFLRRECILKPQTKSEVVGCLDRLNIEMEGFYPDYLKFALTRGQQTVFPLSGIPNVKTLFCNENEAWETFDSDDFGYSNSPLVWKEEELDAVLLGDSYVLGECLRGPKRFASLVQAAFPQTLNLGYSGTGPLASLARLIEYGEKRKPAHIFFFYYEGNDPMELIRDEMPHPVLSRYLEQGFSQNLEGKSATLEPVIRSWVKNYSRSRDWAEKSHLGTDKSWSAEEINLPSLSRESWSERVDQEFLKQMERVVLRMLQITGTRSQFHFFYLPAEAENFRKFLSPLKTLSEKYSFDFVDMGGAFIGKSLDPFTHRGNNHYNEAANALIAEEVIQRLMPKSQSPQRHL